MTPLMPRYVALLRGINVGGKNLIKMTALKACFEANGFEDVATYIQSGNVVFASSETRMPGLTRRIEEMLAETFDYEATVVVRSRTQMRAVVERAPKGLRRRSGEVPVRRDLPEGATHRQGRDDERAHDARRRRGTCGHRRALFLETHGEGHTEPAQPDHLVADLPQRHDPELEHDDEAGVDDGQMMGFHPWVAH